MSRQTMAAPLPDQAQTLARGLGWFSIALGAVEVLAPHALSRWLCMKDSEPLLQAYGIREIATGVGVLASDNPSGWMWGRVAGDGLDLATLAKVLNENRADKGNAGLAFVAVLGVTALDVLCARSLAGGNGDAYAQSAQARDYSDRSGFPRSPCEMRGAAGDFIVPADMRTPALLRPLAHDPRFGGQTAPKRG
jgi:hypothetical protein